MTILCEPSAEQAAALAAHIEDAVVPVSAVHAVSEALDPYPSETVVVLGGGVDLQQALDLTVQLRQQSPVIGVILLRDTLRVDDLTRAIRAGVREVIQVDDRAALADACERFQMVSGLPPALPSEVSPRGHVVTVFAAKGGCGKTTLATNIAVSLNQTGQRVCLVDLDLAFGDVAIFLQLTPTRTIVDALGLGDKLDARKVSSLLTSYRPNLDCILAPVEPGQAERIPVTLTASLIDVLSGMYDYVVIDTPSQLTEHVLAALDASHQHVLPTNPEIPALKNLRLTLDMLDLLAYDRSTRTIVLNRSDAHAGLSEADVQKVMKSPIAGYIPSSPEVPYSINRGVPVTVETPDHPVSKAIRDLVHHHVDQAATATPVRAGRSGLRFRRRSA